MIKLPLKYLSLINYYRGEIMSISECVSTRIRELLKQRNLTIYKLEQLSCVSHSTMKSLLNNHYNACNLKTLFQIIDALNLTVSGFFDNPIFQLQNIDF